MTLKPVLVVASLDIPIKHRLGMQHIKMLHGIFTSGSYIRIVHWHIVISVRNLGRKTI